MGLIGSYEANREIGGKMLVVEEGVGTVEFREQSGKVGIGSSSSQHRNLNHAGSEHIKEDTGTAGEESRGEARRRSETWVKSQLKRAAKDIIGSIESLSTSPRPRVPKISSRSSNSSKLWCAAVGVECFRDWCGRPVWVVRKHFQLLSKSGNKITMTQITTEMIVVILFKDSNALNFLAHEATDLPPWEEAVKDGHEETVIFGDLGAHSNLYPVALEDVLHMRQQLSQLKQR